MLGELVHSKNSSTQEAEAEWLPQELGLHSKHEARQGYGTDPGI